MENIKIVLAAQELALVLKRIWIFKDEAIVQAALGFHEQLVKAKENYNEKEDQILNN